MSTSEEKTNQPKPKFLIPNPTSDPRIDHLDEEISELVAESIYNYLLKQNSQNSLDTPPFLGDNRSKPKQITGGET